MQQQWIDAFQWLSNHSDRLNRSFTLSALIADCLFAHPHNLRIKFVGMDSNERCLVTVLPLAPQSNKFRQVTSPVNIHSMPRNIHFSRCYWFSHQLTFTDITDEADLSCIHQFLLCIWRQLISHKFWIKTTWTSPNSHMFDTQYNKKITDVLVNMLFTVYTSSVHGVPSAFIWSCVSGNLRYSNVYSPFSSVSVITDSFVEYLAL